MIPDSGSHDEIKETVMSTCSLLPVLGEVFEVYWKLEQIPYPEPQKRWCRSGCFYDDSILIRVIDASDYVYVKVDEWASMMHAGQIKFVGWL